MTTHSAIMDDDILKVSPSHAEGLDTKVVDHSVPKPESIRNMSDAELAALQKKMVRQLDCVIIPIVGILYVFNYVDKSALAASKVYGIMEDLNMNTNDFATAISILFAGYIPFQIPSNLIMTKIPRPGLSASVWGTVSALAAIVHTKEGLYVQRVFLGVTEAVFFPGVIYYLSAWYTKQEIGKRLAALFMFQMLGSAFGGFLAAACLTLDGHHGIAGWRWLFIVEGACTVGCGLIFSLIMPEYPHNARLLSQTERDLAVWRLENEAGAGEAHDDSTTMSGFKLAILDPKVWALIFCMGMIQAMGSTVNFFPSIVQTLGYGRMITLLLTAPPYIFAAIWFYTFSTISDRKNIIYPFIVVGIAMAAIAYTISMATLNTGARYFAMMLIPATVAGPQILVYKTLNLHIARPYQKRAAGVAMINSIGGISNIWASYLYIDAPHYYVAFGTCFGCAALLFTTITVYRFHVRKLNRLLDGTSEEVAQAMKSGVTQTQVDLGWRFVGY
ncbi:mfs transporter [Ophiostoma piceae UAMH 11346]|uniref:Mfs transporter n=1 Tax=Ophiostoma piceae (strain UAMH 11346) TaxID=1262450 RepID=S3BVR6_OPHP1|nr:mfs transporter [Ophiostoma piceae UAMH 11346]